MSRMQFDIGDLMFMHPNYPYMFLLFLFIPNEHRRIERTVQPLIVVDVSPMTYWLIHETL